MDTILNKNDWLPKVFFNGKAIDIEDWKQTPAALGIVITPSVNYMVCQRKSPMKQLVLKARHAIVGEQELDWKIFRSAPLSQLRKRIQELTGINPYMQLLVLCGKPISCERLDHPIDWASYGLPPYTIEASMKRPDDQECVICLENVNGLQFESFDEHGKRLVRTCFKCFRMIHGACETRLTKNQCPSCRTIYT